MVKTQELLDAALDYAQRGWPVFPCHPMEHAPLVPKGFYAASCDEQQIRDWWQRFPSAAIGLRTGEASGLFAVDIDPRNNGDMSLEELQIQYGDLPETVESQTGGGGRHLLFRWPGREVPCSVGKVGPGIDVKGDGGYIILPPSGHQSGQSYCWLIDQEPGDIPLAEAPAWLLERIFADSPEINGVATDDSIPEGYRNKTLASQAGKMRQFGMDAESIAAALQIENQKRCNPPLSAKEVDAIAASVGRYEPDGGRQACVEHWPERYLGIHETDAFGGPIYRCLDDIEIEDIDWLWRGFLAGGKLSMLSGDPGTGKSTISIDLAARLSQGESWPDGSPGASVGRIILLSKEDAPGDTIKPRLQLAGADMTKVYVLEGVKQPDLNRREFIEADFNLDSDLQSLERMLQRFPDTRLVIIDPIGNYMGEANSHNDAAVRSVLGPLSKLAMKYNVAVLAVAHLNKDSDKAAIYRTLGSVGFIGIARMAFGAIIDPGDPTKLRRYLLPIKSNLGNDQTGLSYSIQTETVGKTDHPKIIWDPDPVTETIDEIFNRKIKEAQDDVDLDGLLGAEASEVSERLSEAIEWLVWRLASGELTQKELQKFAREDGFAKATIKRAKNELNILSRRKGFGPTGIWYWRLPEDVNPGDYLGDDWQSLQEDELAMAN